MWPEDWCDLYTKIGGASRVPPAIAIRAAVTLREYAAARPMQGVLCHSDLHRDNIILAHDRLIVLDWEYAHLGEPLWDVAGWASNNEFGPEQSTALLNRFLGQRSTPQLRARFARVSWLFEYVCVLWSECYRDRGGEITPTLETRIERLIGRLGEAAA
jgi:thiamine kinase-like enzyme